MATIAAWSVGAEVCGVGSSVIDGSGLAATISTAGMLSGLTSRCEANTWSMSSPRPGNAAVVGAFGWQETVEVPHPVAVAAVAGSEARSRSKVDLRAARALNDLRRRCQGFVVQVAAEDHRSGLPGARALAGLVASRGKYRVEASRQLMASAVRR